MTANEARKITDNIIQKQKAEEITAAKKLLDDSVYPGIEKEASKGNNSFALLKSSDYTSGVYTNLTKMLEQEDGYWVDNSLQNVMVIQW